MTNFVLEPLLDQYLATYPEGQFHQYDIVYQTESQETAEVRSYIVVFSLNAPRGKVLRFDEFLDAYCKKNNKVAVANQVNSVFPDFKHAQQKRSHVFGKLNQIKAAGG